MEILFLQNLKYFETSVYTQLNSDKNILLGIQTVQEKSEMTTSISTLVINMP
jgi:hypothetical protein